MKDIFIKRRKKLLDEFPSNSIGLVFSGIDKHMTNDLTYPFVVNRNFYYLTGIEENNAIYMIVKGNNDTREIYFTEERDPKKELWIGSRLKRDEIREINGLNNIFSLNDFDVVLSSFLNLDNTSLHGDIDTVFIDMVITNINTPASIEEMYAKKIKDRYSNIIIKSFHNQIAKSRLIKDSLEIENIEKAINITKDGIYSMMKNAKSCNMEYELESYYIQKLKFNNSKESFTSIVASGVNATTLHYESNDSKIEDDSLILCDLGALCNNYASDISRTFPKSGKFTEMQKKIYSIVLEANKKTIEFLRPNIKKMEFENYGKSILTKGVKDIGLIKNDEEIDKYYYHSLGHMLGLDVHDVGNYETLAEGMVITVEPGLYIKELNIGIRIEDDILITKDGAINLSKDIIKEIDEIEEFMK